MPSPKENETRDEFLERCIPEIVGEGKPQMQAVAICSSLYSSGGKKSKADMHEEMHEHEMNELHPAEQELADALLSIVGKHGKLADRDEKGIWVGYEGPEENDDADIGVKCSNCYLHESEDVCKIVAVEIHPEGKCRLAVIPPGMVQS
jgi:hypothetical protein